MMFILFKSGMFSHYAKLCITTQYLCTIKQEKGGEIMNYDDFENGYYDDDYISPVEAFEGNEDLYNEWLLNS